jgi:hypothetical protein
MPSHTPNGEHLNAFTGRESQDGENAAVSGAQDDVLIVYFHCAMPAPLSA